MVQKAYTKYIAQNLKIGTDYKDTDFLALYISGTVHKYISKSEC